MVIHGKEKLKNYKNGAILLGATNGYPLVNLETNEQQFILIEKDVTKSKTIQHQLEKIAYIDTETGLMNAHRLEKVITNMIDDERHFSFVYLSIDKFYTLKELHDQQIDQSLIVEFTNRIKMYFQDSTMARINENDFVVITPLSEWFIQGFYLTYNNIRFIAAILLYQFLLVVA